MIPVYLNNRHVGNWHGDQNAPGYRGTLEIPYLEEIELDRFNDRAVLHTTTRSHYIVVQKKNLFIGNFALMTNGKGYLEELAKEFGIPEDVERIEDAHRDGYRLRWKAMYPTIEQYEFLFDHPNFTLT